MEHFWQEAFGRALTKVVWPQPWLVVPALSRVLPARALVKGTRRASLYAAP
jgi:hypothetical protein